MSSEDSDAGPQTRRKRKVRRMESDESNSSATSGSPVVGPRRARRRVAPLRDPSPDSSDSNDSVVVVKRKKVGRVTIDSDESSSSDSVIIRRPRNVAPITEDSDSQWESDFTDNDTKNSLEKPSSSIAENKAIDSDSSDGQSEKCPICLASFRLQEIGVPESCDHSFCLECIQEWSKNVNTCPVDRKEYNSISVKKSFDGKVDRKVTVEKPQEQNEMDIVEDPTFCEICGSNDNEDRLLLCDGCYRYFHLTCVPGSIYTDVWSCNSCIDSYEADATVLGSDSDSVLYSTGGSNVDSADENMEEQDEETEEEDESDNELSDNQEDADDIDNQYENDSGEESVDSELEELILLETMQQACLMSSLFSFF